MKDTQAALRWAVNLLRREQIPFMLTGGVAARLYGAKRPINDIDFDVSDAAVDRLARLVADHITYGPARYRDSTWDIYVLTIEYSGQEIDFAGVDSGKIFNKSTKQWDALDSDLTQASNQQIFGLTLPVQSKKELIAYKSKILYEEEKHLQDIAEIS